MSRTMESLFQAASVRYRTSTRMRQPHSLTTSYSVAPFIVYRSEKYSGLKSRALGYLSNIRAYLAYPYVRKWISRMSLFFYNVGIAALLIVILPLVILSFCVTHLVKALQRALVKRYHPNVPFCDDISNSSEAELVTTMVWIKRHVDHNKVKTSLEARVRLSGFMQHLKQRIISRYGVLVWESPQVPFDIENHLIIAPSKYLGKLMTDEPLTELSGSSTLQKYIASLASQPLNPASSPWQIIMIPLPYINTRSRTSDRSATVVVMRFHPLLMKEEEVVRTLLHSMEHEGSLAVESKACDNELGYLLPIGNAKENGALKLPIITSQLCQSFLQGIRSLFLDVDGWITLRLRQSEFHSPLALGKSMMLETSGFISQQKALSNRWLKTCRRFFAKLWTVIAAVHHVPKILLRLLISRRSLTKYGFYKIDKFNQERTVSWSKPISIEFLQDICYKAQVSDESSIVLTAIALGLRNYYHQNTLQNPKFVGTTVSTLESQVGPKLLQLTTSFSNITKILENLDEQLHTFSESKQLSVYALMKRLFHLVPQFLCNLVIKRLCSYYPVHVTFADTKSKFPHLMFWGHCVEEFTYWKPPDSQACVSITIIKYAATFRVCVLSPFKSLDAMISHRFPQHLNQIAESVGVDRSRIPYSTRTSPLSSNASSPMVQNDGEGDGLLKTK